MSLRRRLAVATGRGLGLGTVAERLAAIHGDRPFVTEVGSEPLSHRQVSRQVAAWAGAVAAQVAPGARVVVALPNGFGLLAASLAVARAGAIAVPVNPHMSPDEVDHVIDDSGAALIVRAAGELEGEAPLVGAAAVGSRDVAAIFYTSGTTGRPKGARLTNEALLGGLGAGALWPSHLRRDEAVIGLPIAHIMGFVTVLGFGVSGIPVYLFPTFEAGPVLDAIEERRATVFVGVPAMYRMLLEAGAEERDLSSIRVWGSGADAMPPDLSRQFQRMGATATLPLLGRAVGEAAFVEGWGMVETGGGAIGRVSPPGFRLPFVDGYGFGLPGYSLRVVDEEGAEVGVGHVGELLVRGSGVLQGYHGDAAATRAAMTDDGYLRTGDLVRRGRLGTVAFAGRKKDVVKAGGFSVFAGEVERAIEEHPDVLEASVVGLFHQRLGEVPAAAVRLRPGATATAAELVDFGRERLASYKAPRRVVITDDLPRGGTGKVQKDRVRALFE